MLDKKSLRSGIADLMREMENERKTEDSIKKFSSDLADLIETFVKSGTVSFPANSVTGLCPPQNTPLSGGAATGGIIE